MNNHVKMLGYLCLFSISSLLFFSCEKAYLTPDAPETQQAIQPLENTQYQKKGNSIYLGDQVTLGNGEIQTFARILPNGKPKAIGVRFSEEMLDNLPTSPSDMSHCYDTNGNGTYEMDECFMSHERILNLPPEIQAITPFKWVLINWNPFGHMPNGVYNVPHFDMHFYIQSLEERNNIGVGPCLNLMDCEDLQTALNPIPAQYISPDYFYPPDGSTVEPAMGGHLVDLLSPEICCMAPFTKTFIFGAYDGKITFYEPMITKAYLEGKPKEKTAIRVPQAWEESGYYPTSYSIRYHNNDDTYTVTLEDFVYRTGS